VAMTEVDTKGIVVVTVVEIEVATVAMTEVATVAPTEVEPQNPDIGVTAVETEVEIRVKSAGDTGRKLTPIIHSDGVTTNQTVRPHSVQYNSFLRSSFSILNE